VLHEPCAPSLAVDLLVRDLEVEDLRELVRHCVQDLLLLEEREDGGDHRGVLAGLGVAVRRAQERRGHDCAHETGVSAAKDSEERARRTTYR